MRRKLLAVVVLCFMLLVALTVVLTSRYREPRSAAGCGPEQVAGTPGDVFLEDAYWDAHEPTETAAQVVGRDVETFE